jgi:hypothetical protein
MLRRVRRSAFASFPVTVTVTLKTGDGSGVWGRRGRKNNNIIQIAAAVGWVQWKWLHAASRLPATASCGFHLFSSEMGALVTLCLSFLTHKRGITMAHET